MLGLDCRQREHIRALRLQHETGSIGLPAPPQALDEAQARPAASHQPRQEQRSRRQGSATDGRRSMSAAPVVEITELEPAHSGFFAGKRIEADGSITPYPNVAMWHQRVVQIPALVPYLFAYLTEARKRNTGIIRGAPANLQRLKTKKQRAGFFSGKDRGDHSFLDVPNHLFMLDGDGIKMPWPGDPDGAVKNILAELGEPWASTSCVWFLTTKCGLELRRNQT